MDGGGGFWCKICCNDVTSDDWKNNNIQQLYKGFVHLQCPSSLLISNIPSTMTIQLLIKIFSIYGKIINGNIYRNYHAVIKYRNKDYCTKAIAAMNGFEIGSNKLIVQYESEDFVDQHYADTMEGYTKSMITADGSQYKYSKKELSLLSSRNIASFLVPRRKIYKHIHKIWMKLLIKYKSEAIEFIYYSKANDTYHSHPYNYVEIPDYLHELLQRGQLVNHEIYLNDKNKRDDIIKLARIKQRNVCKQQLSKENKKLKTLLSFVNENWETIDEAQGKYKKVLFVLQMFINKKYDCLTYYSDENIRQQEQIFAEQREELIKFLLQLNDSHDH